MLLNWYIFKQTLSNVFLSSLVFVGIIWLSQSFKTIKLIINKGAGISDFFILSFYSLPSWLLIALPFGTFAGCLITYLKLENDREIIVMKSAGISPLKLSNPAFFVSILVSSIMFIISHYTLPKTYKNFKLLQNEVRNNSQNIALKENIFIDINKNQTIFFGKLGKSNELEEIFIQDRSDPSFLVEYFSKNGFLTFDKLVILSMKDGTRISTDLDGNSTILNFKRYDIKIKKDILNKKKSRVIEYNEYSFFELINQAKIAKNDKGKLLAEAHSRNTVIFMPFVFCYIVMLIILETKISRIFSFYRKTTLIGLIFIIQSLVLIIKNSVHTNTKLLPLMYLFPLLIIITSILLLNKHEKAKKLPYFSKGDYDNA